MELVQEPCSFAHSCCNPGPRRHLPGTAMFFCQPHFQLLALPSGAATTAGEVAGSRTSVAVPRRQSRSGWDLGVATTGSWL